MNKRAGQTRDGLLARIQLALEQAQSCIKGETPEDITFGEAEDDTFSKISGALDDVAELRRLSTPADQAVREATIEDCAKIVDAECERILSKQVLTTAGDMVTQMAVNANLRMMACFLPELSAAIRSLTTEPKRS